MGQQAIARLTPKPAKSNYIDTYNRSEFNAIMPKKAFIKLMAKVPPEDLAYHIFNGSMPSRVTSLRNEISRVISKLTVPEKVKTTLTPAQLEDVKTEVSNVVLSSQDVILFDKEMPDPVQFVKQVKKDLDTIVTKALKG